MTPSLDAPSAQRVPPRPPGSSASIGAPGSVRLLVLGLSFLAAHAVVTFLLPVSLGGLRFWGANAPRYLPPWGAGVAYAIGVFLVLAVARGSMRAKPNSRRRERGETGPVSEPGGRLGRRLGVALVVGAGLFFFLFRSRYAFLGDNLLRVHEAELGTGSPNEIGAMLLYHVLVRATDRFGVSARQVFAGVSIASGLLYAAAGWRLSSLLFPERARALLVWTGLMTAGVVEIFCGYIEVYPPIGGAAMLLIWVSVLAVRKRVPAFLPLLVLVVGVALHRAFILWAPPALLALWLGSRTRALRPTQAPVGPDARARPDATTDPGTSAIVASRTAIRITAGLLVLITIVAMVAIGRTSLVLPLLPKGERAYALLSVPHVSDYLNAQFVGSVAGSLLVFAALLRIRRRTTIDGVEWVLLLAWILPAWSLFFFRPTLGGADWDILALAAPFSLLFAAAKYRRDVAETSRGLALAIALSAFNTIPWLWVQASEASIARTRDLVQTDRADYYRGHAAPMQLAFLFGSNDLTELQREELQRGMAAFPDDPRYAYNLAVLARARADWADAERFALRAHDAQTDYLPPLDVLYDVYKAQGRRAEQIELGRALVEAHRTRRALVERHFSPARIAEIAREVAEIAREVGE